MLFSYRTRISAHKLTSSKNLFPLVHQCSIIHKVCFDFFLSFTHITTENYVRDASHVHMYSSYLAAGKISFMKLTLILDSVITLHYSHKNSLNTPCRRYSAVVYGDGR